MHKEEKQDEISEKAFNRLGETIRFKIAIGGEATHWQICEATSQQTDLILSFLTFFFSSPFLFCVVEGVLFNGTKEDCPEKDELCEEIVSP